MDFQKKDYYNQIEMIHAFNDENIRILKYLQEPKWIYLPDGSLDFEDDVLTQLRFRYSFDSFKF